ncbi:collagen triple helix repeat-containing protein 1-like [Clytia hemisphaerica]|uniref:CTHRC1 C-terminal domain-containing protein n=1 Tax=Clytia hemisphaerica TaxID=252671 RepID=A0A7M5WS55_9CNID
MAICSLFLAGLLISFIYGDATIKETETLGYNLKDSSSSNSRCSVCRHGRDGLNGRDGMNGRDGVNGIDGCDGMPGKQGVQGPPGKDGLQGSTGKDGKDLLASQWKDCVWNQINDNKDKGLVRECSFKKKYATTYLRISVSSNGRVYGCSGCCKRWFVTIDNKECAPAPIDFSHYRADAKTDDDVGQFLLKGNCRIPKTGSVKIGFHIGNCHGIGDADGYTGYKQVTRIMIEEIAPPQA